MNKHIELVKKWLNDSESVAPEELDSSAAIARAVADAATYAAWSVDTARDAYGAHGAELAAAWVKRYEEMTDG